MSRTPVRCKTTKPTPMHPILSYPPAPCILLRIDKHPKWMYACMSGGITSPVYLHGYQMK